MNLLSSMSCIADMMNGILISPSVTLGISCRNRLTGRDSGKKSLSMSTTATLGQMVAGTVAIMVILAAMMKMMMSLICLKERIKLKKKMRKKHFWQR